MSWAAERLSERLVRAISIELVRLIHAAPVARHSTKNSANPRYNKRDHPIAFHKGDLFAASKKKIVADVVPDTEDVLEDEVVPDADDDAGGDDEVNDLGKDKLIKAVKPKGAAAAAKAAAGAKGKGKGKK